jgi:hypothetical protein
VPTQSVDLTAESMGQFASRVQPILMNACASCHASGQGGGFRLLRTYGVGNGNRMTTQQNLANVLTHLNLGQPLASPFLIKAASVHWTGSLTQAPFKNRQTPAYRTIEDWVRHTVASNPQLQETAAVAVGTAPFAEGRATTAAPTPPPAHGEEPVRPAAPTTLGTVAKALPAPPPVAPAPAPDAYDPGDFNRANHPGRDKP